MQLFLKMLSGMANSADPFQIVPSKMGKMIDIFQFMVKHEFKQELYNHEAIHI